MPHYNVQISEQALDGKVEARLIAGLTEAVASVFGDWARGAAAVDLFGVPAGRRGIAGRPTDAVAPIVTLHMREGAFHVPEIPDAPARLIGAITDAVVDVFGEPVREQVNVVITGVPAGRTGVGGEVA
ncbi:tautomerase family protein [Allostreptomyces psammosilenae]|uniref:Phenylpyruvate tautomerase PptA (4-oxalocrotonate tautomerase family) n=1 Tax=Allostreptomyces psammosilenae TaxID=1892865 RepID=A0A853A4N1_9ACTN|nr:tautomerase family protein [Allostreptomyces psammosilenae]NYI07834.1 phenylpyruvate tautomerase PptA (4-oxalocrotonate tautomerase family) [Allostreptomyces psammosilenae]